MKNKILYVTNKAPHYRIPFFNELARRVTVKFVFTHEDKEIDGLDADYFLTRGFGRGKCKIHFELRNILEKERPDRVVLLPPDPLHLFDNWILCRWCKKNSVPFVFFTERWNYSHVPLKDKVSNIFHAKIMRKADKILVSGKKSFEWVKSLGINDERIAVAPNASEIEFDSKKMDDKKIEILEKYGLKDKKVVLYLGRLISRKGIDYLIKAFAKLNEKNCVLLIVGGGDFYNLGEKSVEFRLKKLVRDLGVERKVVFTGEINHKYVAAYYSLADVFVYPSITEKIGEPWGLCLNEAMQFGLPVVSTTAVGAAYDLIEDGKNGFIVDERDSGMLKERIGRILRDDGLRRSMGKNSLEIVRRNSYERMVEGFLGGMR